MEHDLISISLQVMATIVTIWTLFWRLEKSRQKKFDKFYDRLDKVEDKNEETMKMLGERVDRIERDLSANLNERLAKIEGEMKAHTNILTILQNHFVNRGDK